MHLSASCYVPSRLTIQITNSESRRGKHSIQRVPLLRMKNCFKEPGSERIVSTALDRVVELILTVLSRSAPFAMHRNCALSPVKHFDNICDWFCDLVRLLLKEDMSYLKSQPSVQSCDQNDLVAREQGSR